MIGSIEAGGTKFVCGVGDQSLNIIERVSFPTTTPDEVMQQVFEFFDRHACHAIGIGSFGPIETNTASEKYGTILQTPKLPWINFDFLGTMRRRYPHVRFGWTTDVNAAVLGEYAKGAAQGKKLALYLTVGTGIGGGVVYQGQLLEGIGAPEMGHIFVNAHSDDQFSGMCPFHRFCLEGMAAGPSLDARFGKKGYDIPPTAPVWEWIAYYLAQGLYAYTLTLRPERIILGGGVLKVPGLLDKVKAQLITLNNQYIDLPPLDDYLVLPELGDNAGLIGGLVLAQQQL